MRARVLPRLLLPVFTLATVLTPGALGVDQAERAFRTGNRFLDKGYFADAVRMYTRALEHNPHDATVYYNRALANEMVDRKAVALLSVLFSRTFRDFRPTCFAFFA